MKELKCFYKCQTTSLDHLNICLTQYVLWPTRSPFRFTLAEGLEIRYTLHNLALVNKAGVSYRFCYLENSKYIHLFGRLNRRFHVINLTKSKKYSSSSYVSCSFLASLFHYHLICASLPNLTELLPFGII